MNYRMATILPEITLPAAAATYTVPIRLEEPISRIAFKFNVKKSKNTMDNHPAADITRIELVDGSDVLHATTGFENQALCLFDRRTPTLNPGVSLINVEQHSVYGIDFGRWLFDPELAFVTKNFQMPQLKITYNSIVSDTGGTIPKLLIWAYVFDEKVISPRGFLMSKEHHAEAAPALNAYKYVDLPLDFPYRRIMVRAFYEAWPPDYTIKHVKIDEDNERRIPWNLDTLDYCQLSMARWEQIHEPFHISVTGDEQGYYFTPSDHFNFVGGIQTSIARHIAANLARTGGHVHLQATDTTTLLGSVMGYCPNHCFDFECGDPKDIEDWWDVKKMVGDLRLRLQGGTAGINGEYQVVIQQLRSY